MNNNRLKKKKKENRAIIALKFTGISAAIIMVGYMVNLILSGALTGTHISGGFASAPPPQSVPSNPAIASNPGDSDDANGLDLDNSGYERPPLSANLMEVAIIGRNYLEEGGRFELPIAGSTGWAAVTQPLLSEARANSASILQLLGGQGFIILEEVGDFWYVEVLDGLTGWVEHRRCFINLPDIIPSIVYRITNASGSVMQSSGFAIPGVTGVRFYDGIFMNQRLNRIEYIAPILYITAQRLHNVQQLALADGNTLVLYEAFRPSEQQGIIVDSLNNLMDMNPQVRAGINTGPWGIGWFISTSLSNHQRGVAVDVSLARITAMESALSGEFQFINVTDFELHTMPSPMHELSVAAVAFTRPINITSVAQIANNPPAPGMTEAALLMQAYFASNGFVPLASEWWHFDDQAAIRVASSLGIIGDFTIETVFSVPVP
ncbi:MAG: hypothetical protein FWG65_04625 [Turicibacter sp.]|nr:hypothetical protein [Turicibacter sp.]